MVIPSIDEFSMVRSAVGRKTPAILRPDKGESLLELVRDVARSPGLGRLSPEDVALLIAASVLTADMGVDVRLILPHCEALAGLVEAVPGKKGRERIAVDCAIAYGCGWRRTLRKTREFGLDELWESAVHILVLQIMDAVKVANDRLSGILKPLLRNPDEPALLDQLRDSRWQIASTLAFRLIKPLHATYRGTANIFEVGGNRIAEGGEWDAPSIDFVRFRSDEHALRPLPAGSRYVFEVVSGIVISVSGSRPLAAGAGGRFVIWAGDFGSLQVFFPVGLDQWRLMRTDAFGSVRFRAVAGPLALTVWECGCGSWDCPERHRLSSWFPDEKIGLKDFVNSAINGRSYPLVPKAMIAAMYYAFLSREGWSDARAEDDTVPLPRIRRVVMIRSVSRMNPETRRAEEREDLRENFLLISHESNFRPQRVVRCAACQRFRSWNRSCVCGEAAVGAKPTVVWKPLPSDRIIDEQQEMTGETQVAAAELLTLWRNHLDSMKPPDGDAEPGHHESGPSAKTRKWQECLQFYEETVEALASGDLTRAAELIDYARQKACLPQEEENDRQ